MISDKIEFEMEVGGYVRGTITIGLFTDIVPKTVKNFIKLSTSDHFPSYKENGFRVRRTDLTTNNGLISNPNLTPIHPQPNQNGYINVLTNVGASLCW